MSKKIKTKTEVGKSTKHKNCVTAQTFGLIVVERVLYCLDLWFHPVHHKTYYRQHFLNRIVKKKT